MSEGEFDFTGDLYVDRQHVERRFEEEALAAQVAHRSNRDGRRRTKAEAAKSPAWTEAAAKLAAVNRPTLEGCEPVYASFDPLKAQAELEAATDLRLAEATRALNEAPSRKADSDAYDKARADLADARTAYRTARTFGPGVGL
jgi:membrane protein involved in colicin uptake